MASEQSISQLAGKVAVITGASMGIGEAIAKLFVDHDARVVLLSRDASRVEAARSRIGRAEQTLALACDVRNREEIDRAIGLTVHHFQRIDVWVNNAGHGILDSVAAANMAAVRETFETNFFGTLESMQAVIPIMKQQGGGAIINISSVAGHIPLPYHAVYSATKFAMNALGKGARIELADFRINVLTVCPGYVNTPFAKNALKGSEPKQVRPRSAKGITAERVARAVLHGYVKGRREVVVPWTMIPVIKIYQLFPGLVEWSMRKMARSST
jgi:short-subunit dehydrogenase